MNADNKTAADNSRFGAAAHQVSSAASSATHAVGDAARAAGEKAAETASAIRDGAADAYDAAREKAASARHGAAAGVDSAPFAVLAGGIAIGAIIGVLLPRTEREADILGPVALKAVDAVKSAFAAARSAGQDKLDELGVNKEAARAKVDQLVDTASQAASSAGLAAKEAVTGRSEA